MHVKYPEREHTHTHENAYQIKYSICFYFRSQPHRHLGTQTAKRGVKETMIIGIYIYLLYTHTQKRERERDP